MPRTDVRTRLATGWPVVVPVLAEVVLALTWGRHVGPVVVALVALVLAGRCSPRCSTRS